MGDPNGTQFFRTDLGMHTDDLFIYQAIGRLKWGRTQIEADLRNQLLLRLRYNQKAADSIKSGMMERFDKQAKLNKMIDKAKNAYDSAKGAELSPKAIADACSSMLVGLYNIMKVENDLGQDVNPYTPEQEAFWSYLTYSYVTRGRVQPHYSTIY